MKKLMKALAAIMLTVAVVVAVGCSKDPNSNNGNGSNEPTIPVVETERVILVTVTESTKTVVKGCIISDGGSQITECGVCWSTQLSPDINDSHVISDSIREVFSCEILGLSPDSIYNVRAYAINSLGIGYGNELSFIPLGQGGGSHDEHEYVDLGLPSGLLWATCNVGATTPEGYGDYFAWGETQPKDYYHWSTYRYCRGDNYQFTKYCSNSIYGYNGFTDNLTILEAGDDPATANWGDGWRTPTYNEWDELLAYCTQTWTTRNGVNGRLFSAPNGNTLFLPAAGSRGGGGLNGVGNFGLYWSSSLYTFIPFYAWFFHFFSGDNSMCNCDRYYGQSVRPVRSARQN